MKLTKVDSMCSRTGRDLQRYNVQGCRQVVGCIPYRYREGKQSAVSIIHGPPLVDDLEFLLVSSQKSPRMMFPKGGWEQDESLEEAALRETFEEAGIYGEVGSCLGKWFFKSKSLGVLHEGFMLPLIVLEELDDWPEKDVRQRAWVSYREAMEVCFHPWMKEALDLLVSQLTLQQEEDENESRNGMVTEQMLRNIELEPSIEILAQSVQGNSKEETRMSSVVGESVQKKEDEILMNEGARVDVVAQEEGDATGGTTAYWIELLKTSEDQSSGSSLAQSLKRKVDEPHHHHQLLIEILVSDEPLSIVAQSLHQRNEDPLTSCCSIEFFRTEEPRMGIISHSLHRNEEPRTSCSIEFLRIQESGL